MSLRIVPGSAAASTHSHLSNQTRGASCAPGLHDSLKSGVGPTAGPPGTIQLDSTHPLEARLAQWTATQDALKMTGLRRTFGMAEPIRRGMELKSVRDGSWTPICLGGNKPNVHEDILNGRDTNCDWEDVFEGSESRQIPSVHDEMERKVRMHGL